jgi:hypothetical protein
MAHLGYIVSLFTKQNSQSIEFGALDDYAFYGVEPVFSILKLPCPAFTGGGMGYIRPVSQGSKQ